MNWNNYFDVVIGVEIHVELDTKTKMFSPAKNIFDAEPNTTVNQIDLAYPGTLPLINKQAVKYAIALAKALKMEIDSEMHFDRKNYFYPDLPKGFQITQFYRPIGQNGVIDVIFGDGKIKQVTIERIHLEEDTARQHHDENGTKLDYNRAGVPLIEIVSNPVMSSAEEAAAYVDAIRKTALALKISDAKLEQGSLRADINISLKPKGVKEFGTKVEIKNMNSLNNIKKAIEFEIIDQAKKLFKNEKILQQTKRFDDQSNSTITMRVKTGQTDYKYFPEPNIPFIKISDEFIESIKLPELPVERFKRYKSYEIQDIYIQSLNNDLKLADYFDSISYPDKTKLAKIFFAEVVSLANSKSLNAYELNINPENITKAIELLDQEIISGKSIKKLIPLLQDFNGDINDLLDEHKLKQISDLNLISQIISEIISQSENIVIEYPNRPERVLKMILGLAMKKTDGQISPTIADEVTKKILQKKFNL